MKHLFFSLSFLIAGCTVQPPHHRQEMPIVPPASPPVVQAAPVPESWQPVYQPAIRRDRPVEPMAKGGKTIIFRAGEKYTLHCPQTATLTIKLPAGEIIRDFGVGAPAEWIVEKRTMGIDAPIGVITIGRTPFAPIAELHVITDAEVYQFILVPSEGGVSQKQATLFQIVNIDTEARVVSKGGK